jgi:erythromycin esterase-like protein
MMLRRNDWPRGRKLQLLTIMVAAAVWLAGTGPVQAAPSAPRPQVANWIRHHADQLATTDPAAPLDDLAPLRRMVGDAQVVGLGESTHGAREEFTLKHRVLRLLVEQLGFRSIAWEEDWTTGLLLNQYLLTGDGELEALMREMSTTWRSSEVAAVLRWLRAYNTSHADKVRFVGVEFFATRTLVYDAVADYVAATAPEQLPALQADLEPIRPRTPNIGEHIGWYLSVQDKQPYIDHARRVYELVRDLPHARGDRAWELALQHARQILSFYEYFSLQGSPQLAYRDEHAARNLRWWHRRTGDKVAYWAASAHTARAPGLRISLPPAPDLEFDNAGSHLHRWYGQRYRSIGFTFDHGTVISGFDQPPYTGLPFAVPRPAPDWAERPLGEAGLDQFALDLHADAPPAVQAWLQEPTTTRAIGPSFDPQDPLAYYMTGGSLAQWFDVIVHRQVVTPWQPL